MRNIFGVAIVSGLAGMYALAEAARRPSWIDADGFLHEPFAWMASGRLLLLLAICLCLFAAGIYAVRKWQERI